MLAVKELSAVVGPSLACVAMMLPRASYYRASRGQPVGAVAATGRHSPRRLTASERTTVLSTLNSERYADCSPAVVYATLLDEGVYLCSISTMYRILRAERQVRERRAQLQRPQYTKPELLATAPNQVWSWDITRLHGPVKWSYFQLYVILDIFSRFVVGWLVAPRESEALAVALLEQTCAKQQIGRDELVIHADRGSSMTSKSVAFLLADLGVEKTHSRPHVSNDNPYSESQFKTMKYRPEFPRRFASIEDARMFCRSFIEWYNGVHRHSGIGLHTPEAVHYGRASALTAQRAAVLAIAFAARPERFVGGAPQPPLSPLAAWINPPEDEQAALHRHASQRFLLLPLSLDAPLGSLSNASAVDHDPPMFLN
jgi:putative transposase